MYSEGLSKVFANTTVQKHQKGDPQTQYTGSLQCIFNLSSCIFIVHCLFFNFSRLFLNISCIFSIHASSLCIHASILFSRFWIIFTNISLNSFAGRLLFSLHLFGLIGFTMFLHLLHISVFTFCFIYCVYVSILQVKGHNSC